MFTDRLAANAFHSYNDYGSVSQSGRTFLVSRTWTATAKMAEAECASIKAELTLFETNQEYFNVTQRVFNGYGRTELWIKLNTTDADDDMVYEHNWRNEPVNKTAWVSGEPADCGKMVNASVPCCPVVLYYSKGLAYQSCTKDSSYLCSPINECLDGTANCSQICTDDPLGYTCSCRPGFTLATNNKSCNDVDECRTRKPCPQVCNNTEGSYTCACYDGYVLTGANGTCADIDECLSGPCQQVCTNKNGSFSCSCQSGYTLGIDNVSCVDVNECANYTLHQCQQICVNSNGSYECRCEIGYSLTPNGHKCTDINECLASPCPVMCQNTNGSYVCQCGNGYSISPDGHNCTDTNECLASPCQHMCQNTNGSYECQCDTGFSLSPNRRNCTDIDECLDNPCLQVCNNTYGSYTCSLKDGYTLDTSDAQCNASQDTCDRVCVDASGSLACQCGSGYAIQPDNRTCVDVDECAYNNNSKCTGPCTNTDGGYFCGCPAGYKPNQTNCTDIDECNDQTDNCSQHCNNTIGGYNCSCKEGYRLQSDQSTCVDIDECKENLHACSHSCVNNEGSFNCACYGGYFLDPGDKTTCHDMDECNTTAKLCDHQCNNTPGSFYCSCQNGYTLSGKYCLVRKMTNFCPCSCLYLTQRKLFTIQYAKKQLVQLKQQLGLLNSNLTSYKLQKSCQDDPRSSAESMGYGGVAIIAAVLGVVILPDMLFAIGWVIVKIKGRQKGSSLGKLRDEAPKVSTSERLPRYLGVKITSPCQYQLRQHQHHVSTSTCQHQHPVSASTLSALAPCQHQNPVSTSTLSAPAPCQHQPHVSTSTMSAPAPVSTSTGTQHQHQHLPARAPVSTRYIVIFKTQVGGLTLNDFQPINVSGVTYFLSKTQQVPMSSAISSCAEVKAVVALFDTNLDYFNALKAVMSFSALTDVWVRILVSDDDGNLKYEHRWKNEPVNVSAWYWGEPSDNCLTVNMPTHVVSE
ncbi:hypothetical protein Btru_033306 [Bulinus truncatus]|nr:hypothetical protein Btru_033306 [Bulinus truncatus]